MTATDVRATAADRPTGPGRVRRAGMIRRIGTVLLVAMCVAYASLAFELTGRLYSDAAPELWEETFARTTEAGILTAPLLRVGWIAISRGSSGLDQWDANLAYTMSLLPQTVLLAALWRSYRKQATEVRFPASAGSGMAPKLLHGLALFGIAALANDLVRLGAPRLAPPRPFPELGLAEVGGLAFAAYAAGSAIAMLVGAGLLRTVLRAPQAVTFALPVLRAHLGGVVLGSVGLLALVASAGDRMLGGIASVYYWAALVPFWGLTTGLMVHALIGRQPGRLQEWTVYSVAMSFQSAVFHLAYLAFGLFAFGSPTNRVYTAAIISFAGVLITAYVVVAAFGSRRPLRRRTVAASEALRPVSAAPGAPGDPRCRGAIP